MLLTARVMPRTGTTTPFRTASVNGRFALVNSVEFDPKEAFAWFTND